MDKMIAFTSAVLSLLADFLAQEPIIYLFGLFCLLVIVTVFRRLMP